MSVRKLLFLKSAIFLLFYRFSYFKYVLAHPRGVFIVHTLSHGFNSQPGHQLPEPISFGGMNSGYMPKHERHPWERHQFGHSNDHANHDDFNFEIAQPHFHNSGEFFDNKADNAPPSLLQVGPLEAPNVALTEEKMILRHPWHNPHGRRHHHRWHAGHRCRFLDYDNHGENLPEPGYEAGGFGQTAIFETAERENVVPQRANEDEHIADGATDFTKFPTPQAVTTTTAERAKRIEETTTTYETTTINSSAAEQTTEAAVTSEPTESTFTIDIRGGFA